MNPIPWIPSANMPVRAVLLLPGQPFTDQTGPHGQGWQIVTGVLRLDGPDDPRPVLLAQPGDLIGVAEAMGVPRPSLLRALVGCRLAPLPRPDGDAERHARLSTLVLQQWRQTLDMARLRNGSVPERVKQLLLLLTRAHPQGELHLPRLRDLAATVDSTPESVSRVIANLRRLGLLAGTSGRQHQADESLAGRALPAGMTSSRLGLAAHAA